MAKQKTIASKNNDENVQQEIIVPEMGFVTGTNIPRKRNKVAICGFAPSTMRDVQFVWDDPDTEIWGLNQLYVAFPAIVEKATRWFQIHHRHSYDQTINRDHSHHEWLTKQTRFPIYMQQQESDVPMSIPFPVDFILTNFRRYFTNSISWEIALAILEGFKTIYIFGVDMAQDCIAPETKILTADLRWVRADKIKVGQTIMGFDENTGPNTEGPHSYRQWRSAIVAEANRIIRPSYRIHLADGTKMIASAGHQWLTYGEHMMKWKRTDELDTNMHRRPTQIVKVLNTWEEEKSWEAGYLAAAFDGEGHISQHQCSKHNGISFNIGFGQRENAMSKKVDDILCKYNFEFHCYDHPKSINVKSFNINGGKIELLRFLGAIRPRRLLSLFDPDKIGTLQRMNTVAVEKIDFLGDTEVIGFKTSTKTFIAEGFGSHNSEYQYERPSVEYFCGFAEGRGIKLIVPEKSDLLKAMWLYPFENIAPFRTKMQSRRIELRERAGQLGQQTAAFRDQHMQILGALENMNYIEKCWVNAANEQVTGLPEKKSQ